MLIPGSCEGEGERYVLLQEETEKGLRYGRETVKEGERRASQHAQAALGTSPPSATDPQSEG
eukprot:1389552-Rhodomonas_salina.1